LDHRFGWSPLFPIWLNFLGLVLIALGYTFAEWALVENRFFSTTVRIQTDRGHVVCDSGPYRIVRHPGYAGNIPPLLGITLEDRTLQDELPGYRDYARRVRYRLIPGIF
jgi:protein-S-isoprenylcysteine O-methyltransferase Ste14